MQGLDLLKRADFIRDYLFWGPDTISVCIFFFMRQPLSTQLAERGVEC